jgi:alpha-galactosidase
VFSLQLMRDLCLTPGLAGSHVVLMDIDPQRLEAVTTLSRRLADEMGADLKFEATLDQEHALTDTDFVINTAYASGHERALRFREATESSSYYYSSAGIYGPIDIWAFDDLKFRLEFARAMERLCPDAWLLQSGNPVFEGCTLMTRETGIKVIGICHGYLDYQVVSRVLGLDPGRVRWQASGLNHQIWLTSFLYDGVDAYPLLDAWIANQAEDYWRNHRQQDPHDIVMSRGAINLYQLYGRMPIGDAARDSINWWLHSDFETKKYWFGEPWGGPDTEPGRRAYVNALQERMQQVLKVARDSSASASELVGTTHSREIHIAIIDALANGNSGQFQVNVPNRGTVPGVPDDVVVEVQATIDRSGVHAVPMLPLPRKILLEQILPRVLEMEQQLETLKSGDSTMLLRSALMNHQTRTYQQAVNVVEALGALDGKCNFAVGHAKGGPEGALL